MDRRRFLTLAAGAAGAAAVAPWRNSSRATAVPPAGAAADDAAVALAWFDRALALVHTTPGYTPPVAARALGYAVVTLYETAVPGMPGYASLAGVLNDLPPTPAAGRNAAYDWPAAVNAALARILRLLFPSAPPDQLAAVDALEASRQQAGPPGVISRSVSRGRAVADAIFAWSRTDGGHEGYLRNFSADYAPPVGDGLWRPTPPAFQRALQPTWGSNRPFALPPDHVGWPGPPTPFSSDPASACFTEAVEVYDAVNQLTDEQRAIALFWSDDPGTTATPPGHSVSILTQQLRADGASLATAAEAYAKVGVAVADAFIACWRVKYQYNVLRPITYINDHVDGAFGPAMPLVTPPFPEYTSGHSVQSAAAAAVLTDLFGTVAFTDHTHDDRGLPARSFASFDAAAAEAAISRLYGGIHYVPAIERGLVQGRAIGELINQLPLTRETKRGGPPGRTRGATS